MADRLVDYIRVLQPDLVDAPVFIADAVAEQIDHVEMPDPDWTFPAEWYGKLAPPFPWFWVEADTWFEEKGQLHRQQRASLVADLTGKVEDIEGASEHIPPGTEWIMGFWGFSRVDASRTILHYAGTALICVSKEGRMLTNPAAAVVMSAEGESGLFSGPGIKVVDPTFSPDGKFAASKGILNLSPFTWRTIGLLHERCETEEVHPNRAERRQFQRQYSTDLEPVSHHVLRVKPYTPRPNNPLKGLARPERTAGRRAHDVRATWAYYSPDKPLFGRPGLSGMFRRKAHERGDDHLGRILKTYRVEPGGES
jgi:hypothetical protein